MHDAYTAGIIDGEGSIGIFCQDGYYHARVKVGMSDKGLPVLRRLERRYGGKVYGPRKGEGNARDSYEWRRDGSSAITFIELIYPHLAIKRAVAEVVLQLRDMVASAPRRPNGKAHWDDNMRARAEVLKLRANELNARGAGANMPIEFVADREPIAVLRYGEWMRPDDDLFGPVPLDGPIPASGSMRGGVLYEVR